MADTFDEAKAAKVRETIVEWTKHGNIKFEEVPITDKPALRIGFDSTVGSWSYVGNEAVDIPETEPTMNLASIGTLPSTTADESVVILHEFGHALGLVHEHQSPTHGNKFALDEEAVYQFYTDTHGWTREDIKTYIIDVYNKEEITNYAEFDEHSIMLSFMPATMNKQRVSITPAAGVGELSPVDKASISINYPTFKWEDDDHPPVDPRELFIESLDVVGVDGDDKALILEHFDAQNWKEVRYEFTHICNAIRIARKSREFDTNNKNSSDSTDTLHDGCIAEEHDLYSAHEWDDVDADLWLPGEEITYTWIQGTLQATAYRKNLVKSAFDYYSRWCNLTFKEIPHNAQNLAAKIHVWFGPIPDHDGSVVTGWSKVGRQSVGFKQSISEIARRGGSTESSIVFSDTVIRSTMPANTAERSSPATQVELRTVFHEIGHALGLKHKVEPGTSKPSITTYSDPDSVMLPPSHGNTMQFNCLPSEADLALLGAIYPARPHHVDDNFEEHISTLGLQDKYDKLNAQRLKAFRVEGHIEFRKQIKELRRMLHIELGAVSEPSPYSHPSFEFSPSLKTGTMAGPPLTFNLKSGGGTSGGAEPTPTTGSFLNVLVSKLSSLFEPTSGQIFALQFPGRFLQQDLYAWDTKKAGIYGQFVKPTVVNENEFRLVDQLYNTGKVIGAPNGLNLSIVYEQVLNNLVPKVELGAINMTKQQAQIRQWLLKDVKVSGWVQEIMQKPHTTSSNTLSTNKVSTDNKVNRMELAEALMRDYLASKQKWELERDSMILNKEGLPLEDVTRKLAHITAIREAELAAKYSDAVVRGYEYFTLSPEYSRDSL
ncbi:hypothetical protein CVT24_000181, partial [Panaeolus cyanescens]